MGRTRSESSTFKCEIFLLDVSKETGIGLYIYIIQNYFLTENHINEGHQY